MYYNDNFAPGNENNLNDNEFFATLEKTKQMDRGYNKITIKYINYEGKKINTKISVYTSCGYGNFIRDAETGAYYKNKVGTLDEDLFFKVKIATGELKSSNDSSTLFYSSPYNYTNHLRCGLSQDIIKNWETRRDARLKQLNSVKQRHSKEIVLK
jgi:hypothetical protein